MILIFLSGAAFGAVLFLVWLRLTGRSIANAKSLREALEISTIKAVVKKTKHLQDKYDQMVLERDKWRRACNRSNTVTDQYRVQASRSAVNEKIAEKKTREAAYWKLQYEKLAKQRDVTLKGEPENANSEDH